MTSVSRLSRLPGLPPPVLTVYLDVNPANPRNQGTPPGYIKWLKSTGQAVSKDLPRVARREFRTQLTRVEEYLRMERARSRGLAVFAGPEVWEVVPLQVDVTEELHWGKPSLQQMAWVFDEHSMRGAVVIEGFGARFFRFWLGRTTEDKGAAFVVDKSAWRKPYLVGPSTSVVAKQFGVHRDQVRERIAAQRARFIRTLADRIVTWCKDHGLEKIFLVGAPEDIEAALKALPSGLRSQTTLVAKRLRQASASDIRKRLQAVLERQEREDEQKLIDDLMQEERAGKAALGLDRALTEIQEGRVREIVVARGMNASLRECEKCGWMDRSADTICAICGSPRRPRTFRTALPELAVRRSIPIEVVAGKAAAALRKVGGIGVRLRTAPGARARRSRNGANARAYAG